MCDFAADAAAAEQIACRARAHGQARARVEREGLV